MVIRLFCGIDIEGCLDFRKGYVVVELDLAGDGGAAAVDPVFLVKVLLDVSAFLGPGLFVALLKGHLFFCGSCWLDTRGDERRGRPCGFQSLMP